MKMHIIVKTLLFLTITTASFGQANGWTDDQQRFYTKMKLLCEYFDGRTYDTTEREFVFREFVYFDNILSDTSKTTIQERVKKFDGLFYQMTHFIDSVGINNLEARPTVFFKNNKEFFEPYEKGRELNKLLHLTLTYFDKRIPDKPIGTLLFDDETHKLLAWIVISQAGYHYFLTFNLL